jgi:hypothetical protein
VVQVIQIKRKTTGAGVPATLAPGELAYNTTGHTLVVGDGASTVQNLVSPARQVELTGDQSIAGNKTIPVANLKLTGGLAGNVVQTDGAGNLSFVASPPPTPATAAEMALATRNDVFDTPLASLGIIGVPVAQLTTTEKTIVPAINGLKAKVDLIASGTLFVASFDASTGVVTWTPGSGQTGNALPTAGAANKGWYLIASAAGSTPPTGAPAGAYSIGDWLISNGATWTWLAYGGTPSVTANNVAVSPAVAGATDVQAALTAIDAALTANTAADAAQATDIAGKVNKIGDTMTGPLNLPAAAPTAPENATNKAYVDAADLAINTALALKADTAAMIAADALKLALAGGAMTGAMTVLAPVAAMNPATMQYVDDALSTLPGGGLTSVAVTAPHLTGDGTVATPIAFAGITAEAVVFGGNGLTGTPLTLLVVDGGSYA